ncbi:MAG: endonuclease/exonuclease/phosphatase family protein [Bryobacteraceae bacterium]
MRLLAVIPLITMPVFGCELRVLTWNIHHGEGIDGKLDFARIGRVIRDARPDIVALQEVDVRTERIKGRDTVRELERLTGMRGIFGASMQFEGGGYGNAVLVNGTVLGSRVFPIGASEGMEPRSLLMVEMRPYRCSLDIAFFSTHFDHKSEEDRMAGAAVANLPISLPAILAGDLNAPPDDLVIGTLMQQWASATKGPVYLTSPSENPKRQIDYVLFRPAKRWTVVEAKVIDETVASDHRPLLAVLKLLPDDQ